MKRRVIQIGNSTQLISLPRKWALQHNIRKGDELNITDRGSALFITTDSAAPTTSTIQIDLSGMDVSSIMQAVQGAYKSGYDEISLTFSSSEVMDLKAGKKIPVLEVFRLVTPRLIGAEIISQRPNSVIIRDISQTSIQEFDNVLRRIFLLVLDIAKDIASGFTDPRLLSAVQDQHNTVTKFVAFCLRLLNKHGYEDVRKTCAMFHIIASLDKITDILKYTAQDLLRMNKKPSSILMELIQLNNKSLHLYYELFYKFQTATVMELSKNRRIIQKRAAESVDKLPSEEAHILARHLSMLDTLLDLTEWRMAIEYATRP